MTERGRGERERANTKNLQTKPKLTESSQKKQQPRNQNLLGKSELIEATKRCNTRKSKVLTKKSEGETEPDRDTNSISID